MTTSIVNICRTQIKHKHKGVSDGGDRAVRVRDGEQSRRHVLTLARSSFYCCFVFVFSLQNRVASDDEDVRADEGDEDDDDEDEGMIFIIASAAAALATALDKCQAQKATRTLTQLTK